MLFGMPVLIELNSLEECAALCRELGLDFVEISMSLPQYTVEAMDVAAFKEIADQYGIFFTIHLDENVHFFDFNSCAARACRQYLRDTIGIARALGVPAINTHFHRGEYFTLPDRKVELFALYKDHYRKSVDAFRDLCEEAIGTSDLKSCIENCNGYPDFQKEALEILLASPAFGLTFDVGHNHGCGGLDESYIIEKKEHLCHMHLHDALGRKNHMVLGSGELDLHKYLKLARELPGGIGNQNSGGATTVCPLAPAKWRHVNCFQRDREYKVCIFCRGCHKLEYH